MNDVLPFTCESSYWNVHAPFHLVSKSMLAEVISISIITFLSFVLNLLLAVTLILKCKKQKSKDLFLFSLTASELLQATLGYPIEIATTVNYKNFNNILCKTSGFLVFFLSLVAIWHLTALSIERMVTMKYPFIARRLNTKKYCALICLLLWFLGLLWSILPFFGWSSYEVELNSITRCNINLSHRSITTLSYTYALLISCYMVPVGIIAISYCSVWKELKRMLAKASKMSGKNSKLALSTYIKVRMTSMMIFIMIILFVLIWLPYVIILFLLTIGYEISPTLLNFSSIFAKTSSFSNPIIYGFAYKDIRKIIYRKIFKKVKKVKPFSKSSVTCVNVTVRSATNLNTSFCVGIK